MSCTMASNNSITVCAVRAGGNVCSAYAGSKGPKDLMENLRAAQVLSTEMNLPDIWEQRQKMESDRKNHRIVKWGDIRQNFRLKL